MPKNRATNGQTAGRSANVGVRVPPIVGQVYKYIVGAAGGFILSVLAAIGAYASGFLDSYVREIVFRSIEVGPGTVDRQRFVPTAEDTNYHFTASCGAKEKITGGFCRLTSGSGVLQNTGINNNHFICTYRPVAGERPPDGLATATCLTPAKK
ncbi:hypothetical protein FHP25_32585 [Vineibacter terrae]|uniref:Uncharacterized protein n=1 Tax=Vineibacter terrae TaxID=2586908 RepID=A0A5C8PBB9_9HYPH|nr:hypothetical protein [Vineibacter terrae]TXL70859.1 hypothetical protein FHP25_32585 [Vineibacter terrae]